MAYSFINNFSQTLAAELAIGSNNVMLDANNELFSDSSASNVYVLTLEDGEGAREIVHVFALFEGSIYLYRAQEGTTEQAWPAGTKAEMRMTAGIASSFVWSEPSDSVHALAVSIQPGRSNPAQVASGTSSIAVGNESQATGSNSISVGPGSSVSGNNSVVFGPYSSATVQNSAIVGGETEAEDAENIGQSCAYGYRAKVRAKYGMAMGAYAVVPVAAEGAISVGWGSTSISINSVIVGRNAEDFGNSDSGVALGPFANIEGEGSVAIGHIASTWGAGQLALGPNSYPNQIQSAMDLTAIPVMRDGVQTEQSYQHASAMRVSLPINLRSLDVSLATIGDKDSITLPANTMLCVDRIESVVISSAGSGSTPTISIGTTLGGSEILAAHVMAGDTVLSREQLVGSPMANAISALYFKVDTASAAAMTVRFVVHGYVMEI